MADAFVLRWKLDRPYLEADKRADVYVLLTIEPNPVALAAGAPPPIPMHLILLVDVSGSMNVLVRHDPQAQPVGNGLTEGKRAQTVLSEVPSRREMARGVVQKMVERLNPNDLFTLIAYDDKPHVLAKAVSANAVDALWPAIQKLGRVGGGGTRANRAFDVVREILTATDDGPRTRKLVLLTDGEDDDPQSALSAARSVGWDHRVPIVAFGTGECKVAFLTELAKTSLAGAFNHVRDEAAAQQLFGQVQAAQKNVQATDAQLRLWLSPELQVRELYRTRPEILFIGDLQPDPDQQVTLRLEQMEHGKAYEFLFRCSMPPRPANQRFRIAKATLTYDIPSENVVQQKLEANIVVEYAGDPARAAERSGDVRRVLARAEVQRQVLFLQGRIDALARGTAGPRDRTVIANLLQALIAKFQDFGEQALVNQYRDMQQEYLREGTIAQEMLNRSLAASLRAEEIIVAQDIDF